MMMNSRRITTTNSLLMICLTFSVMLTAPFVAQAALPAGCVTGSIADTENGEPVNWATVTIIELNRTEPAHDGGRFTFCQVPAGTYTLAVRHIGYLSAEVSFTVGESDTTRLQIRLEPSVLQGEEVVITAEREKSGLASVGGTQTIAGANLQQNLGRTLAETIRNEPGVAQQSMGPATARPVVRGLGGDRLVILEDGAPTGDASSMSADHAVTADPMAAERIEILRGPASFVYSANALGGIINMEREKTVTNRPDRIHGTGSIQGESVNTGFAVGGSLGIPAGPLGIQAHGSYRNAADISTPDGKIRNTDIETFDGSAAAVWLFSRGSAGGSAGYYRTDYGLPGGFAGAHPDGVRIDMDRQQYAGTLDYHFALPLLKRMRADFGHTRYYHSETESGGAIGTEFGILTTGGSVRLYHDSLGGIFDRGILSIQGETVNLAANGLRIPETNERSVGATLYEEKRFGPLSLSGAIRFDVRTSTPGKEDSSETGRIRKRSFNGVSGGLAASFRLTEELAVEGSVSRTFRTPSVEELFSEGPHLASYSYEIGNADLEAERGLSLEGSLRYTAARGYARLTGFRNAIDGYIFPDATGDTNYRTLLPIYRHTGERALLTGIEAALEWELPAGLAATGTLSYVRGERTERKLPLPFIPPLNGSLGLRWSNGSFFAGATARGAAAQERTGEFEEPTDGYAVFDAFAQYRIATEHLLHTIVLNVENVFDAPYRNHLARTKAILPEPGRNMRLLYRIYF